MTPSTDPKLPASLVASASPLPAPFDPRLAGAPAAPEEDEGGIPWGRYLSALRRYKWLLLGLTTVGTATGVFAARRLPMEYEVQATIWIQSPGTGGRAGELMTGPNWVDLLRSFAVLDTVVRNEGLYLRYRAQDTAAFRGFLVTEQFRPGGYVLEVGEDGAGVTLSTAAGLALQRAQAGDSLGLELGFAWRPEPSVLRPGSRLEFEVLPPRDAGVRLAREMLASMPEQGNMMRVRLTGDNPARITRTLNATVEQFVRVAADLKAHKLREESRVLREQLEGIGEQLRDAENALESYKTRIITQPGEATPIAPGLQLTQPTVITRYFNEKVQAEELQRSRDALRTIVAQARGGSLNVSALLGNESVRQTPAIMQSIDQLSAAQVELRTAQERYTDESRQVQAAQERVRELGTAVIPGQIEQLIASLDTRLAELEGHLRSASRELQAIPQRAITEQRLERERSSLAEIYTQVQSRYQAARLAEASAVPDVTILDRAVQPTRPSTNMVPRIIGMAFLASLGAAIGLAILLDQLDKRFRYPDQVTRELGLTVLGAIPNIRRGKRQPSTEEASQVVEAFRTVRMNLTHSYGSAGPVMLTVTSPQPGDGKSVIASNLALSFADAGYRTVLIDGDTRRGELHRLFGAERVPGLLDHLADQVPADLVQRTTQHANLTLVPCGTRMHHGPELLSSPKLREFLAMLKQRYAVIIFDSPPLGAGIDPFVLGSATGNLLLVLRSGETDRQLAETKLELVDRLPIRLLGAVLNDISTKDLHYRYYAYSYGYTEDETTARLSSGSAAG